jgi:hypothetical protein
MISVIGSFINGDNERPATLMEEFLQCAQNSTS